MKKYIPPPHLQQRYINTIEVEPVKQRMIMNKTNEVKSVLQQLYSEIYSAEKFAEHFCVKANRMGMQGSKRLLRYDSTVWHNMKNYIMTDSFDSYGIELSMEHPEVQISGITSIQEFYRRVLESLEKQYENIHTLANSLVNVCAYPYTKKLLCICSDIMEHIKHYRRMNLEGNMCSWNPVWILQMETSAENLHDTMEKREKEVGYPT